MDYYEQEQLDQLRAEARAYWHGLFIGILASACVVGTVWAVTHV